MELIISKYFLEKFYDLQNSENEFFKDFELFLGKKIADFILITDFSEDEFVDFQMTFGGIYRQIEEKAIEIKYLDSLETKLQDASFFNQGSSFKLFCLDKSNEFCDDLEQKYGYLFFNLENIINKWKTFYSQRDDDSIPIDTFSNPRFDDWQKLQNFHHPLNTIIIFDLYLFSESNRIKTENNLFPMLKNILLNTQINKKLEICIFIKNKDIRLNGVNFTDESFITKVNSVKNKLIRFFSDNYANLDVNIFIVNYQKQQQPNENEHDRGIYTNYFFIPMGKGINIFDVDNNITSRSKIDFMFTLTKKGRNNTLSGLKNFKTYINSIPRIEKDNYFYNKYNLQILKDDSLILTSGAAI